MARKKIIAGNWKMNKTPSEAKELVELLKPLVGRAERAADVLAIPAAAHFVQILMEAQFHMRFSYSYHILRISCDSISIACGALRRKFTVFHFGLHFSTHHAATAYLSMQRCNS